jgi:hypothetical protein
MKNRWFVYSLIGLLFGIIDWYYLDLLSHFTWGRLGQSPLVIPLIIIFNYGIWLLPVVPIAIYEVHRSKSTARSAAASVVAWGCAILSYYAYYTALLAFWGLPNMDYLLFFRVHSPTFWADWAKVFKELILNQFIEWTIVAIIGGSIIGLLTSRLYLYVLKKQGKEIPAA